ncbi:MAG: Cof-type HAD-IIB family hydrolase [Trueperaceae bacterium]
MDDNLSSLFVFDVDGTLLDSGLRILPSTRACVQQLLRAGHRIALASARPPRSVMQLSQQLLGTVTEIISLNGAFVTHEREVLLERTIPAMAVTALIRKGREFGIETNLLAGWEWLVEERGPGVEAETGIVGFEPTVVADLERWSGQSVHKVLLIGEHDKVAALREWALKSAMGIDASLSKETYCEVVADGTSKAGAVLFLAEKLAIPRERLITFGDGENDLPMIEAAGVGVAMGNAMEAVKVAAGVVTESNDEDGIANALRRLGFIE